MSFNKVAIIFLIFAAVLMSGCKKNVEKADVEKKVEEKQAVDCSMFVPPWGEEFWEDWGRRNGGEFEAWYTDIIPKMSKVTEADISACSHLDNIFLGFSTLKTLDVFKDMKHLRKLDLRFSSNINDLTPLKSLENLEFLSIWKTNVTDLTPIKDLPKLKRVDAKMTAISDISMLSRMKSLESIDLLQSKVNDASALKDIDTLKDILYCSTDLEDLSPLYPKAGQIEYMDLCNTKFRDFESLKKFKNLKRLKVWGLPITDASIFSGMEDLWELDLWSTKITDLSPIYNLKKLKRLVIIDLKIAPEQIEEIKKINPGIEIVDKL
jgi:Leucine-rich repeat (LRR) protein